MRPHTAWATAIVLVLAIPALAQPAPGAACRFDRAVYAQPDSAWTLRFARVPRDAAANQSARFILHLTSGIEMEGAVYWPNGYGAPIYLLDGPCSALPGAEACTFLREGSATPYILGESGIEPIPFAMEGPAPGQLLLPRLAVSLWYSQHRNAEFAAEPGDVFTLAGCQQGAP